MNNLLPGIARSNVDHLNKVLNDGMFKLEAVKVTTIEYVKNISFLDEIQGQVIFP